MKKGRVALIALCFMLGVLILGGGGAYAVTGILAERSKNDVFIDGQRVELDAYLIEGNNYVKLRDVGKAVGFNVFWDGKNVQVVSDAEYTGQPPAEIDPLMRDTPESEVRETAGTPEADSGTDFSLFVSPEVFTEQYHREAYNAVYQVLLGITSGDLSQTATVHFENPGDRQEFENLLVGIANGTTISLRGAGEGTYYVYAHMVDREAAKMGTDELVSQASRMHTDREKVALLNNWICDHMSYNTRAFTDVNDVATSQTPVEGRCTCYARVMNYLCGRIGLPCISVYGDSHCWNAIYADGEWSYTDVSLNDQVYDRAGVLLSPNSPKRISDPSGFRFLQELLVPGSTS